MPDRLNTVIDARLNERPDASCYWWKGTWHTGAELLALAGACEKTLREAGFGKGQRLVVLMPNSPMVLALCLAVWRLGGVFCPLNEKTGEISLLKTLDLLRPFAVAVSEKVKKSLTEALDGAGWPAVTCSNEGPLPVFTGKTGESDLDDLAVIFSTSGTTGDPKAVPLTHANILDNCQACIEHLGTLTPENRFLNVLPNFHAFGFTVSTMLPLVLGASQALVPSFMPPQDTLRAIQEAQLNTLLLVPTMVSFLTAMMERANVKLTGIDILIAGGDRYNQKIDGRVTVAFGVPLIEGYGITECSPVLAVNKNPQVRRLGTVGTPLPRFELQLRDEEGKVLDGASEGVLWTRGPSVASGYYRAPEVTAERFDKDGWFNTGDYVRLEDGYIHILDRVTDILIVSGFNVYPQEVEAILAEHPAVQTAVVVGMPQGISGEVPKAYVIKNGEVTESELIRFCKDRLAHYKVPRAVEFVTELPISSTGKILRRVLRQREQDKANGISE